VSGSEDHWDQNHLGGDISLHDRFSTKNRHTSAHIERPFRAISGCEQSQQGSPYSITSSASSCNALGTSMPSNLAVCALITASRVRRGWMPADGISLPPKREFGTSRWAARRLATRRKGHDRLWHEADMPMMPSNVCFRGQSGHRRGNSLRCTGPLFAASPMRLLDDLIRSHQHCWRYRQAECFQRLFVNDEAEARWLLEWQIGGTRAS
jgi:hypothetical protein